MRKLFLATPAMLLAVAAISFGTLFPSLGSGIALADGALVIQGTQCRVLDGDGRLVLVDGRSQSVITPDPSGVVKLVCHVDDVTPPASGHAEEWNFENTRIMCSNGFGRTRDWREVITPSGHATLTCFINPNGGL